MNVYLETIGCRLNEAEVQSWTRGFHRAGHRVVASPARAHVIVLNTCAVTGEAARKSRQFIRRVVRQNPGARVVVTGCFAELEPRSARSLPGVDVVLGNREKDRLVETVLERAVEPALSSSGAGSPGGASPGDGADADRIELFGSSRTRAFVKVQDGCRHRCTFCIVTVARGAERSRPRAAVVGEINDLHRSGYQEVVLTGVHLGGYGSDLGSGLGELVSTILRETSIPRVRLSSLEPWDLPPHFFELWRDPRLMPHLHLPLQSGSDRVLRAMGRRTSVESFRRLVSSARSSIDALTVTTDIIVGFPGETADDWRRGMAVLQEIGFGHIHAFTYSPRRGTPAAARADQVPIEIKRERAQELNRLAARMKRDHLRRFVGDTRPVLWETNEESGANEHATSVAAPTSGRTATPASPWRGYSDNYLRVEALSARGDLRGAITPARIFGEAGGQLLGEIALHAPSGLPDPAGDPPPPRGRA